LSDPARTRESSFGRLALSRPVALCLLLAACSPGPPDTRDYAAKIAADRAAKDAEFLNGPEPIPQERKAELLPLAYFDIDPEYSAPAALKLAQDDLILQMPTSTGGQRQMRRVGTLEFSLKGQPLALTAFVEAAAPNLNRLFIPFMDLTSGTETYAGGRYIDLDRAASGVYVIDFNLAYTPYCYYNPSYDCPYPPAENRLKVPVRAGERLRK
jgi:uncharacterized protein (DUF1684 family)